MIIAFFYGEERTSLSEIENNEEKKDVQSTHEKLSINDTKPSIKLHNLKKDIDKYPDIHEILKSSPETEKTRCSKMEINFGEDSKTQVNHDFFSS